MTAITPFTIDIDELTLDDLRARLALTRWPDKETVDAGSQGVRLAYMQEVRDYWANAYDWRPCEKRLNDLGGFQTEVDGVGFHFLHCRSPHKNARPLIITHGWPGSLVEFLDIIPLLTDPSAHGGNAKDAFHVVAPSLPGYGFSGKPTQPGWKIERIADAWATLMARLGYETYFAQGGDWGSFVTVALINQHPDRCRAAHINMVTAAPPKDVLKAPSDAEKRALATAKYFQTQGSAYLRLQATQPQTIGYALSDSPIGQAAWILDKFFSWSDCDARPETAISRDRLLDNVMMYWLTGSAASSARLYWESAYSVDLSPTAAPIGCTIFPREISTPSRRWAEGRFKNIIHWNEVDRGGHFAAMEQPEALAKEIRACFANIDLID